MTCSLPTSGLALHQCSSFFQSYMHVVIVGTGFRSVLKQAAVPLINRTLCNSQQWLAGDVTDNMFCAGHPNGQHDGCEVCITLLFYCLFVLM